MANPLLPGTRFSRLVVVDHDGGKRVTMRCDCGIEREMLRANVVTGKSKSCGCQRYVNMVASCRTHGKTGTRLHRIWQLMRARCRRQSNPNWPEYGGRGIRVCDAWDKSYVAFEAWALANGYADALTIERRDNDGPYSPENCCWATRAVQARNRRNTVYLRFQGKMVPLTEVARQTGKKPDFFYWRLRSGVSPEHAVDDL